MGGQGHSKGGKANQFLGKLVDILNDFSNSEIITFEKKTSQIVIPSRRKLQTILPLYFNHSNFYSFTRQLNWFGFQKVRNCVFHTFQHSELRKGKSIGELTSKRKINRRKRTNSVKKDGNQEKFQSGVEIQKFPGQNILAGTMNEPTSESMGLLMAPYPSFAINPSYQIFPNESFPVFNYAYCWSLNPNGKS